MNRSVERCLGSPALHSGWYRSARNSLWARLPRPLRRLALHQVFGRPAAPLASNAPGVEPVCIIGPVSSASGVGEAARLAAQAFAALGCQTVSVDTSPVCEGTTPAFGSPPPLEAGRGTAILNFNPYNLSAVLTLLGRSRLRGKRIIGHWVWELPRMPDEWRPALAEVDEVWTPSPFVADSIRPFTHKPVRVVSYPVAVRPPGRRCKSGRAFVVLTMFSFASFERKNPLAAVRAFRRAFGDSGDHQLVLKGIDAVRYPREAAMLRREVGAAVNISIIDRPMADQERTGLIAGADALLSLHRSEGFGLVLAEAMLAGVAVVATGWSGNLGFMDDRSALLVPARLVPASGVYDGGAWAEPDVDAAAAHLRALAADPGCFAPLREAARRRARELLGIEAFHSRVAEALPNLRLDAAAGAPSSVLEPA